LNIPGFYLTYMKLKRETGFFINCDRILPQNREKDRLNLRWL